MSIAPFVIINKMYKGKDTFCVSTKDAFAFFIIRFSALFPAKNGKERLRAGSLKDALAFMRVLYDGAPRLSTPILQVYF
jgi:hypothetical protein